MIDLEKVIKGLECLAQKQVPTANPCKDCGYSDRPNYAICVKDIASDALELLRKQKQGRWIEYPAALRYEEAYLPEHIVCSACEYVFCTLDNCTEEFNYCPHCGAKMIDDDTEWK